MVSKVSTVAFQGITTNHVGVEVHFAPGLPNFFIVGLADKAVAESRERIRASFHHLGLSLPPLRITVNLSPADIQKEGSHYDLPVALGILAAMKILDPIEIENFYAMGEMGLDGTLSKVTGILPAAMHAAQQNCGFICPEVCGREASWAGAIQVLAAPDLLTLIHHFQGKTCLAPPQPLLHKANEQANKLDLKDIKGQSMAKRALEIAAAGGHNILLMGPPGAGKSMLAQRLPGILPPLSPQEALDVTMIHSLAGLIPDDGLVHQRPFRDPHHSSSLVSLVGGGSRCKPGEISLAHKGVLFLDELPEFARATLESLRQPLETGKIVVARANHHATYPADIQVIAAMNPCRCGYWGDVQRQCHKADRCSSEYQSKLSGPLLDRFDLSIFVSEVKASDLMQTEKIEEGTGQVLERVITARKRQELRFPDAPNINSRLSPEQVELCAIPSPDGQELLASAIDKMKLSARSYHRLLKVSRTIADLSDSETVERVHVAEALSYRMRTM